MLALLSLSEWIRIILVSPAFLPRATSNAPFCGVFVVLFCFSFWVVVVILLLFSSSSFFFFFPFLFMCVIFFLVTPTPRIVACLADEVVHLN